MTKAAQDLAKWNPASADDCEKWRKEIDRLLKTGGATTLKVWEKSIADAGRELKSEMKSMKEAVKAYGDYMEAFHADVKERLANGMRMVNALTDKKTATPALFKQAKGYVADLMRDLDKPLSDILNRSAQAQGNRLNLFELTDVTKAIKAGSLVPEAKIKLLLKDFQADRKSMIDMSAEVNRVHVEKLKTYVPRAKDLMTQITKLEILPEADRGGVKEDLAEEVDSLLNFFNVNQDGNFLMPTSGVLKQTLDVGTAIKGKNREKQNEMIVEAGGEIRVAGMLKVVSVNANQWKIIEKRIDLVSSYAKKVNNATILKKVKTLATKAKKNKAELDKYKAAAELVATTWKATADLRA